MFLFNNEVHVGLRVASLRAGLHGATSVPGDLSHATQMTMHGISSAILKVCRTSTNIRCCGRAVGAPFRMDVPRLLSLVLYSI